MPSLCPSKYFGATMKLIPFYGVFLAQFINPLICTVETEFYAGEPMCNVDILTNGCSEEVPSLQGLSQCFLKCLEDYTCIGISTSENDSCFLHKECTETVSCQDEDKTQTYYSKHCAHGGKWNTTHNWCQCVAGWIGQTCLELPSNCRDLILSGYPEGRVRTYFNLEKDLLPVYCSLVPEYMYSNLAILFNAGNVGFDKGWVEYRDGFHVNENNFWAGLKNWSKFSQIGYVDMTAVFYFKTNGSVYRRYSDFHLSNESGHFQFNFTNQWQSKSGYIGQFATFGDCFGPYVNVPFSTYDKDMDGDDVKNCASVVGSGWWYKGCDQVCNMFGWGPGYQDGRNPAQWMAVKGVDYTMVQDEMPITHIYIQKQ